MRVGWTLIEVVIATAITTLLMGVLMLSWGALLRRDQAETSGLRDLQILLEARRRLERDRAFSGTPPAAATSVSADEWRLGPSRPTGEEVSHVFRRDAKGWQWTRATAAGQEILARGLSIEFPESEPPPRRVPARVVRDPGLEGWWVVPEAEPVAAEGSRVWISSGEGRSVVRVPVDRLGSWLAVLPPPGGEGAVGVEVEYRAESRVLEVSTPGLGAFGVRVPLEVP